MASDQDETKGGGEDETVGTTIMTRPKPQPIDTKGGGEDESVDTTIKTMPKPQPIEFFSGDMTSNWNAFKEEWDAYEEASGLNMNSSTDRVITFLRVMGKDALNIYNSFSWPRESDARNIDKVIEKFESLCLLDVSDSSRLQRYLFYKRNQDVGEQLEDYIADIRKLAETCDFGALKETMISDCIIFGLRERWLKEEMLKNEDVQSEKVVEVLKEKVIEFQKKEKEKLEKAFEISLGLKNPRVGQKGKMADDMEGMILDDMNGEEAFEQEDESTNGAGEVTGEDELILKADSDIEIEHEEETSRTAENDGDEEESKQEGQTRRDTEFTSEDFKIELGGLPNYYSVGQLKRLLNETLQLKAHKVKPSNHGNCAFVTFRDEKSRTKALAVLDDYKWKKATLNAKIAKAVADPVVKRNLEIAGAEGEDPDAKLPIRERGTKSVTPLAHIPYKEQLDQKQKAALKALRKLGNEMAQTNPELQQWVRFHKLRRKGQVCEVEEIVASPVTEGYRNKCEFTVGINPEDELPTVGFRVSSYKSGSLAVCPVDHFIHISDTMKKVAEVFEAYVRESNHKPFSPLTHEGVWRQLTVRTSSNNDILIAVVIHPQEFTEEQMGDIKQSIVDYFKDGPGSCVPVTSIYFQTRGQKEPGPEDEEFEHLWGEKYVTETVLGKTFRISCESFFQVNTKACEVLYDTVASLAELDGTSVILDICCGTGTIGISLADQCLKVYGIEMVKKAAEDARENAAVNDLDNIAIYTGKAEVNMNAVMGQCVKYNTVGIVDPPRAGLPESVIRSLRKCDNMNRLIYMSCDPEGAYKNFIDLSRPKSKQYKGEFFVPIKAAIVDMFPHTPHYELLIVFERWEERKWRRIMEGNPLPRDSDYFKRIPAQPEIAQDSDSDGEPQGLNTGMGNWKSISKRRNKDNYHPYMNPRQQYGNEREEYEEDLYSQRFEGRGMMGGGPSRGLMGMHPYEESTRGYYGGGPSSGRLGDYDRFYNPAFDRPFDSEDGGRFASDPYRLNREEYDRPFEQRYGPISGSGRLDSFRQGGRGFMRF